MASESLGTLIKRARERKRWTQQELANRIGVNRKTVDNWENGRTRPRNSVGALEDVLGELAGDAQPDVYADPDEAFIWSQTRFRPGERRAMIEALRRGRGGTG